MQDLQAQHLHLLQAAHQAHPQVGIELEVDSDFAFSELATLTGSQAA